MAAVIQIRNTTNYAFEIEDIGVKLAKGQYKDISTVDVNKLLTSEELPRLMEAGSVTLHVNGVQVTSVQQIMGEIAEANLGTITIPLSSDNVWTGTQVFSGSFANIAGTSRHGGTVYIQGTGSTNAALITLATTQAGSAAVGNAREFAVDASIKTTPPGWSYDVGLVLGASGAASETGSGDALFSWTGLKYSSSIFEVKAAEQNAVATLFRISHNDTNAGLVAMGTIQPNGIGLGYVTPAGSAGKTGTFTCYVASAAGAPAQYPLTLTFGNGICTVISVVGSSV